VAAAGFVLSVPISYYGESRNRVKIAGAVAATAGALALVAVAARTVRRSRRSVHWE
jgi:uncharacterized protein YbaA (DUF1428 family)